MAPGVSRTELSSGDAIVDDAKRALDNANGTPNSKAQQPDDKGKRTGVTFEDVNKGADAISKDDGVKLLFDGVNSLVHSLPPLLKALEAVAQIHPFVSNTFDESRGDAMLVWLTRYLQTAAVGAFKVVVELEIKRRDNDKKVNLLFLEMRNMMSVLLQLQSVPADHATKDGITVGTRLSDMVARTADDIKECANVCDTYSKKRLLVKILKGPIWDDTLKGFIQLFVERKAEFTSAISLHTSLAVDRANVQLDKIMTRAELILQFFVRCVPPSQRT